MTPTKQDDALAAFNWLADELYKLLTDCELTTHEDVKFNNSVKIVRQALTSGAGGEWRPISEAPRDGTWVLLYAPPEKHERATGQMYVSTWQPISYNWEPQWAYGANGAEHRFRDGVYGATHFMPLPAAPGERG